MGAGRADAVDGGRDDPENRHGIALNIALYHLARQGLGHKHRPIRTQGNAIPKMAKAVNGQDHSAASCSSTPMNPPD
jgi:hypothetical protein